MDSTLPNPHSYSCRYCQDASRIPPTSCLAFHKCYSVRVAPKPRKLAVVAPGATTF